MKKIILFLLLSTLSLSSLADCTNAYQVKAAKRAKSNKVLKKIGVASLMGGGTLVASAALISTGAVAAVVGTPLFFAIGTSITVAFTSEVNETKNNTFYKGLRSIEAAKNNTVTNDFLKKLDKMNSYYSLSTQEQQENIAKIIKTINKLNKDQTLCKNSRGKIKPMNYRKFVKTIYQNLN